MSRYVAVTTTIVSLFLALIVGVAVLAAGIPDEGAQPTPDSSQVQPTLTTEIETSAAAANTPESTTAPESAPALTSTPSPTPPASPTPTPAVQSTALPTATPEVVDEPLVDRPVNLSIPAIGMDARVEWVGINPEGDMDIPSRYDTTAWFEHGARPGMTGNAVIAGHFDSKTGPAVFYSLGSLAPGDEIVVTAQDGERLRFRVDRLETFTPDEAPRYEIFGPSSGKHLNLITCEGEFDPSRRAYDLRLVVYSTLVED